MEYFRRIIDFGIKNDTGIKDAERIRNRNQFSLVVSLTLLLLLVPDILMGNTPVLFIHIGAIVLFFLGYFLFPPQKALITGSLISLSVLALDALAHYFLLPQISIAVLFFVMIFPLAGISLVGYKGIYISLALLLLIIVGNFFSINESFVPLNTANLIIFSLAYISVSFAATFSTKNLSEQIEDQNRKVDYYESEIRQRDEFISNLSHKLRTSLSNITLINNLVHDSRLNSAQKELLDTLKSSTYDLINDVNDLVEIATPTIVDFKQSILSFKLEDTLSGIHSILQSNTEFHPSLTISGDDKLEYNLIGDPSLLRSIIINLIKGLNHFQFKDNSLELLVSKDYETQNLYGLKFTLSFNVKDLEGIEESLHNLANRLDSHSPFIANAYRLLEINGTKPAFKAYKVKQNLYFYLEFSKDLTKGHFKDEVEIRSDLRISRKRELEECNILLVEDNAINQKIVLLSLSKLVKHIDVASNGKEALDMFGLKKYDAILMDIQMPVMDGITATKKIREIESTSDEKIPIIAITANALAGDRDNCLAAGVDEYISKPFQVDDLIDKLNKLIA